MNSDQFETGIPAPQGLYDFEQERDACGVGLVADLKNEPSHKIIEMGITVLKRLMHRGAVGSDPDTGDGAGILLALPDEFFRLVLPNKLPARGKYGVAMMFGGCGHEEELEAAVTENGGSVIAWRQVPVDRDSIGKNAQRTCPLIRQLFIDGSGFADQAEFERKLFVMRREMERRVEGCYVCSCSSRSIVYKGLFLGTQIEGFYGDLASEHFKSPLALVHQRYSTNTFPTWSLAHPFRYLAHNGEINTLRGNLNHLSVREPHLSSTLLGDDLQKLLPLIPPGQSDSACLDNMVELLAAAGRDLRHVMLMLMPQAWGVNYHLGPDVRGFFEYHSAMMEPWDGPTAVVFSDGINAGAMLDRNGLRPARYTLTTDDIFILASETGVADIPAEKVARKGRLRPGEMIYCDLVNHRLVSDAETKNEMARRMPYRRWVEKNKISVRSLFDSISASAEMPDLVGRQRQFGFTQEDVELIIRPMMLKGAEPLGSMGNDAPLAVLSGKAPLLFNYFKQLFAQVTNPPIDPIREELVMSLTTYIGNHPNILEETPEHARLIKMARPVITDEELNRLCNIRVAGFPSARLPLQFPEGAGKPGGIRRGPGQVRRAHSGADGPQHRKRLPSRSQSSGLFRGESRAGFRRAAFRRGADSGNRGGEGNNAFCASAGLRSHGGQSVPGSGDGYFPGRAAGLPAGCGESLRKLHQCHRQGIAQNHVQDGHFHVAQLPLLPAVRGGGSEPGTD